MYAVKGRRVFKYVSAQAKKSRCSDAVTIRLGRVSTSRGSSCQTSSNSSGLSTEDSELTALKSYRENNLSPESSKRSACTMSISSLRVVSFIHIYLVVPPKTSL